MSYIWEELNLTYTTVHGIDMRAEYETDTAAEHEVHESVACEIDTLIVHMVNQKNKETDKAVLYDTRRLLVHKGKQIYELQ